MLIDELVLGAYENNCYVVRKDKQTKQCLIVDTGLNAEPLINFLLSKELEPVALLLTHGHADHIAGVTPLRDNFPQMKVCVHTADAEMLTNPADNLSTLAGQHIATLPAEVIFEEQSLIEYAGIKLELLHTPGHTQGGVCFYSESEKTLFSGDTLFAGSIGRTDFPRYDMRKRSEQLIENIKTKLLILPDDTKVLPGHGPVTTIGNEKLHNPYLR